MAEWVVAFRRRARQSDSDAKVTILRGSRRPVVITALPLKPGAREQLAARLGGAEVHDIREVVVDADLVLAPSCSPHAVSALKRLYPTARIVIVELDDWECGVELGGPVKRLLDAGADAYLLADSIEHLAQQLRPRSNPATEEAATRHELLDGSVDEVIIANVQEVMRRRAETSARRTATDS